MAYLDLKVLSHISSLTHVFDSVGENGHRMVSGTLNGEYMILVSVNQYEEVDSDMIRIQRAIE